jgi:hypothetical protein
MTETVEMLNFIAMQSKRIADSLELIQYSLSEIKAEIVDEGIEVVIMDRGDSLQDGLCSIAAEIEKLTSKDET